MTVVICLVKVLTEIHYRLKQDNIVTTEGKKRVKVVVIIGHFKQIVHGMSVISLSNLLQIKKVILKAPAMKN